MHRFDKLEVFVGEDFYKIDRLHGSALYEGVPQVRTEPLVSLRLSDEQRVFPPAAEGLTPKILLGPSRVELQRQGRFMVHDERLLTFLSSSKRSVFNSALLGKILLCLTSLDPFMVWGGDAKFWMGPIHSIFGPRFVVFSVHLT